MIREYLNKYNKVLLNYYKFHLFFLKYKKENLLKFLIFFITNFIILILEIKNNNSKIKNSIP